MEKERNSDAPGIPPNEASAEEPETQSVQLNEEDLLTLIKEVDKKNSVRNRLSVPRVLSLRREMVIRKMKESRRVVEARITSPIKVPKTEA